MRWAYIIKDDKQINLSEKGCNFLESEITEVDTKTKEQEMAGMDGVLVGANTFGSFALTLKFYYEGIDKEDLLLFTEKMKTIIHNRTPMYVVHSDFPGRKYAFNSAKIEDFEAVTNSDATFSITFNCYKGYSESLKDTSDITILSDYWQFEDGVIAEDIRYTFTTKGMSVWNGSQDIIDPLMGHNLRIRVKGTTSNGFTIINRNNGTTFEYNGSLSSGQTLEINGVHPTVGKNRVGYLTNYDWIKLEPGFNNIEIISNDIKIDYVDYRFNFIYR